MTFSLPASSPQLYLPPVRPITAIVRPNVNTRAAYLLSKNNGADDDDEYDGIQISNRRQTNILEDNLVVLPVTVLSSAAILASVGTLWSEYSVVMTGCGPQLLPDVVERSCYLGALVVAGLSVFTRIVTGWSDLATIIGNNDMIQKRNKDAVIFRIKAAEWMSLLAVGGAFVALASQTINGEQMDGLSGINIEMCRAIQLN